MEEKTKSKKIRRNIIIVLLVLIFIIIFSMIFAILNITNENIVSGVYIQGIEVSNLSKQDLEKNLQEILEKASQKQILLKYGEEETTISLNDLNIKYNLEEVINEAYGIGRKSNIIVNNYEIIKAKIFKININMNITYDVQILKDKINAINAILPNAVQEYNYYIEDESLIITKGKKGIKVNEDALSSLIIDEIYNFDNSIKTIEIPVYEKEPDEIDIEKIQSEIYKEPEDAYITQNPTTVHPHVNGVDFAISIDEANELLKEDKEEYTIPLKIIVANKTISDLGEEAFPNTLGTFTTRYDASNKNRSNNISLASNKIDGTVILPGETFSYNQIVGKRTIEAGYKEAGAYAGGKVIQEVGGGICQVSSTLYNAVLYANLEIVERSNHYFQTSYVDAGRDATVSWGTVDFKFKNNRTYPIKIEANSSNGVSKISIKGINEEKEYEVVIQSKITSIINKTIKYEEDDSLDYSTEIVEQEGHNGCTSQTYKILKYNGATVSSELLSSDYYHSLDKIIRKGTKQVVVEEEKEDKQEPEETKNEIEETNNIDSENILYSNTEQ